MNKIATLFIFVFIAQNIFAHCVSQSSYSDYSQDDRCPECSSTVKIIHHDGEGDEENAWATCFNCDWSDYSSLANLMRYWYIPTLVVIPVLFVVFCMAAGGKPATSQQAYNMMSVHQRQQMQNEIDDLNDKMDGMM